MSKLNAIKTGFTFKVEADIQKYKALQKALGELVARIDSGKLTPQSPNVRASASGALMQVDKSFQSFEDVLRMIEKHDWTEADLLSAEQDYEQNISGDVAMFYQNVTVFLEAYNITIADYL